MIHEDEPSIRGGHSGGSLEFRRRLLKSWGEGDLADKELCAIAFFSSAAGAKGVSELGVNPASRGEHHRRGTANGLKLPLDKLLGRVKDVPMWNSMTATRVCRDLPIQLPLGAVQNAYEHHRKISTHRV